MNNQESGKNRLKIHAKKAGNWIQKYSIILLSIACLLIVSGGAAFLINKYNSVAAPGTNIAGINISGQNIIAIKDSIEDAQGKIQLTLSHNGKTVTANSGDLGINIDIEKTATKALLTSNDWINRINLFGQHNIQLVATYNYEQTQKFLTENFPELITNPAKNSNVVYDNKMKKFVTQASVEGEVIDMDKIKLIIEDLVVRPRSAVSDVAVTTAKPDVDDQAAQSAADLANARLDQKFYFQINGQTIKTLSRNEIASWAVFTPQDGRLSVTFDQKAIVDFINTTVQENVPNKPINNTVIVGEDNTVLATTVTGRSGHVISNSDEISRKITTALQDGQSISLALETKESPPSDNKFVAIDGHWIEVDLTNWLVTAYKGKEVVAQFTNFAKGATQIAPDRATITGTFKVYRKQGGNDTSGVAGPNASYAENMAAGMARDRNTTSNPYGGVCMPNDGGDTPFLCSIHYVTYWGAGGYAFHEAWWMTPNKVRTGLSHGCINMWKGDAKFIYDFSQIGTPVWVHN